MLTNPYTRREKTFLDDLALSVNSAWVLVTAFLVIMMQAGFALLEAGFTRSKNTTSVLMKNTADFAVGIIAFFVVGFAIAFGSQDLLSGTKGFFMEGLDATYAGLPLYVFAIFQFAFAATAATIVSGALAERTKFWAYMALSALVTGLIYPVVAHWVWGGGWLSTFGVGFRDFAGSTVVHSTGAWVALVAAIAVGPRIGKFGSDGKPRAIPGHSMALAFLGTFILWIGWYGFNPGSTLALTDGAAALAAKVAFNTTLAAGTGFIVASALSYLKTLKSTGVGKTDAGMAFNGALGGLVAITAPCAFVAPWAAIVIGACAGAFIVASVPFFDHVKIFKFRVDDPVGAISVHGTCGVLGTLAIGFFATDTGLFYGGGISQLAVQALGVAAVFGWVVAAALIVVLLVKFAFGLRVSKEEELEGLDRAEFGTTTYIFDETVSSLPILEREPQGAEAAVLAERSVATARIEK